jgi:hypothetical protein
MLPLVACACEVTVDCSASRKGTVCLPSFRDVCETPGETSVEERVDPVAVQKLELQIAGWKLCYYLRRQCAFE